MALRHALFALLALFVLSASCLPVDENVQREKRGIFSGGIKGGLLGALAGALLPGVSAKQGAGAGAALGAGLGLFKKFG